MFYQECGTYSFLAIHLLQTLVLQRRLAQSQQPATVSKQLLSAAQSAAHNQTAPAGDQKNGAEMLHLCTTTNFIV